MVNKIIFPNSLKNVSVHNRETTILGNVLYLLLWSIFFYTLWWCYSTIGLPYAEAIAHHQQNIERCLGA